MSDALVLLQALPLEDGRHWGEIASQRQLEDARAVLEPGPGEPLWHFLTRPRGGSKTTDLAGLLACWLAVEAPPSARGYVAAADLDQAGLLLDALRGFVSRSPALRGVLRVEGQRAVSLSSGASVTALPADGPSAHGLLPHFVVVDELAQWADGRGPRAVWSALVSGLEKVPGARLVVITTAGDPASLAGEVIGRARDSADWRVSEMPGPLPWLTAAQLGRQRAVLLPSEYARLHLNRWTTGEESLVEADDLQAALLLEGDVPPVAGREYVGALDLGWRSDAAVLAVGHLEVEHEDVPGAGSVAVRQRVVVDVLRRWAPDRAAGREVDLAAVEAELLGLSGRDPYSDPRTGAYGGVRWRVDPWQAAALLQRMQARGVRVEATSFTGALVGRLGRALFQALAGRQLALPRSQELEYELARVRLRPAAGGGVRLDHPPGGHDDQAVALALVVEELLGNRSLPGNPAGGAPVLALPWRAGGPGEHVPGGATPYPDLDRGWSTWDWLG